MRHHMSGVLKERSVLPPPLITSTPSSIAAAAAHNARTITTSSGSIVQAPPEKFIRDSRYCSRAVFESATLLLVGIPAEIAERQLAVWRTYLDLTKPKVVTLIVFTAIVGALLATPGVPPLD